MASYKWFKLRVLLLTFSLLVCFTVEKTLAGTTGKIAGKIFDSKTNESLPGANITIVGTTMGASSDVDGNYFILNVPPGTYSVRGSMMGYGPVVQQEVRVNTDRTTLLDFGLSSAVLDLGEEVVITSTRPLVEQDVVSSQVIATVEQTEMLPVSNIMDAISLEPGIEVNSSEMKIEIRGGGSDEISFQVDGMERNDKLNNKVFAETNSASVSEVQILTGGFNAEYGNIRSGLFNVITKEGGKTVSGSFDYRTSPGHQKHFGPSAYGDDQYDNQLYGGSDSFEPVFDVEGGQLFAGWNAIAETKNAESWMGKSDWTPQQLQEVWKWTTRGVDYGDKADHYIDAGLGGPVPGLDKLGLKDAGFFLGYKYTRQYPILPSVSEYYDSDIKEAKFSFKPMDNIKVVLNGLYGETMTSTNGNDWDDDQWTFNYGNNVSEIESGTDLFSNYKYYLGSQDMLYATTKQIGFKLIHTINPSTYYEVKYNYFTTESEAGHGTERNLAAVKTIGGVAFDEGPVGWIDETASLTDLTGNWSLSGGGLVSDTSSYATHKFNIDFTSQVNQNNLVKAGFEFAQDHIIKDFKKQGTINVNNYSTFNFDRKPSHYSGYIQDKIEYGGMIVNAGIRIDHYAANGYIYDPTNIYSLLWARGGTAGYATMDDLPKEASEAHTYLSPRLGFSHPVRKHTKFFFNYGIFYSEPTNTDRYGMFSESMPFGDPQGDIRRLGYANLEAPRTSAYEIGFEQSIADDYLIRANFYSKDNTEMIGKLRVDGQGGSASVGDFVNGVSAGVAGYDTRRNNIYQDIRGIEMKISKLRGRFFTGWLNMDYRIKTQGNYGLLFFEPGSTCWLLCIQCNQTCSHNLNLVSLVTFLSIHQWIGGTLKGNWRLSFIQRWDKGSKYIYNPDNLPAREVRTIYYWLDSYYTSLRLSKSFTVYKNLSARLYMDVNNLFNYKKLNLNVLADNEKRTILYTIY